MRLFQNTNISSDLELQEITTASYSYEDFIYSITLRREVEEGKLFTFIFGEKEEFVHWSFNVDFENNELSIANEALQIEKEISYELNNDYNYKINLIVNSGIAKVYVNDSTFASLVLDLPDYQGGNIADNSKESNLTYSNVSLTNLNTLSGDYFIGGYKVKKVINLTDNNYRLSEEEYVINAGVITIDDDYLNTLENNYEYKFRAVTSLTDFDFYVKTKEVGAEVTSLIAKYYRGDDVKLELNENTEVHKTLIDNKEVNFTQKEQLITIESDELSSFTSGEHRVKLLTNDGRPETSFSLYEVVEIIPEPKVPVNYTFFIIDISIFAALILGYVGFTLFKKHYK